MKQLKKVRLSATSVAVTELQFRIALLKGFYRDEGLDVEIILIRIKDRSLAAEVFDLQVSRLGGLSYLDDAWMRGAVDFTKKSMALNKDIAPSQIFDFSFAAEALGRSKH